jgi:NADPH:quinone reductase-like Zn-dependent oxidoreductase
VIGTVGGDGAELVRRFGAETVRYGDGLADRVRDVAPAGVDVALDTIGTDEAVDVSLALVADRRRIATIAAFDRAPGAGIQLLGNGPEADPGSEIRSRGRLVLTDLVRRGRLRVEVAATFPLAQAAEAHRLVAGGHAGGKVVLLP